MNLQTNVMVYMDWFDRANWHSPDTLTEVFPCFLHSCKANARACLAFFKTGQDPHSS